MKSYEYKVLTILVSLEEGIKPLSKLNQQTKKGWIVDEKYTDTTDLKGQRRLTFVLKKEREI